jgi:hypothetical protein
MDLLGYFARPCHAVEVLTVLADAYDGVGSVDAVIAKARQCKNGVVEALSTRKPPHREDQLARLGQSQERPQICVRQARAKPLNIDAGIDKADALGQYAEIEELLSGEFAVGDDTVRMPVGLGHGAQFPGLPPGGDLLAMGIDDQRDAPEPRDCKTHKALRQDAPGMHGIEPVATEKAKRAQEQRRIHPQRLGTQPPTPNEPHPMYAIGMVQIVLLGARDVGGDHVNLLAAEPAIHFVKPYCSAALGRQEQLGQDEQPLGRLADR